MKKILSILLLTFISSFALGQSWTLIPASNWSHQGYPRVAIPGSDHFEWTSAFKEVDNITAYSWNGLTTGGTITFTANNNLSVGDWVNLYLLTPQTAPVSHITEAQYTVSAANPTSFTLPIALFPGDATSGSMGGQVQKIWGAGVPTTGVTGTWSITQTGTDTTHETFKLYITDGSASTSFSLNPSLGSAPPQISFTVGSYSSSTPCAPTGNLNTSNRQLHCPVEFDLTYTLDADPTKTTIFHYIVAENGGGYPYQGKVFAHPGYRQIYKNRSVPLGGYVWGNVDQHINWTITTAPGGGDATLTNATLPQPVFNSGTVAGKYYIRGCPAVDANTAACDTIGIYVSANAPPAANTDMVEQVPCDIDPSISWATIVEVDPTGTVAGSIHDFTLLNQNNAGPYLIRYWNKGANGSPTTLANLVQINQPNSGGPFNVTNPAAYLCGVANPTTGELPILSGNNATSASWTNDQFVVGDIGLMGFTTPNIPNNKNSGGLEPFSYVTVTGLHIQNLRRWVSVCNIPTVGASCGPYSFISHSRGTVLGGDMGVRFTSLQYGTAIGNYFSDVATPLFDDCNSSGSGGWSNCSQDNYYEGNRMLAFGNDHTPTEHGIYTQTPRTYFIGNLEQGAVPSSDGTGCWSSRSPSGFIAMYNYCVPNTAQGYTAASGVNGTSEVQGMYNYADVDSYFGYQGQGAPNCTMDGTQAPDCLGAFGGIAWFAAEQELHDSIAVGNITYSWNTSGVPSVLGIGTTNDPGSPDAAHRMFESYNTWAINGSFGDPVGVFQDRRYGNRISSQDQFMSTWPRMYHQNSIMAWMDNSSCKVNNVCALFDVSSASVSFFGKNLVLPNQVVVTSPLLPEMPVSGPQFGNYRNGVSQRSWQPDFFPEGPIGQHLGGFVTGNFPTCTSCYNATTFRPASDAVGKAGTLSNYLAYYPPTFSAIDPTNPGVFVARNDLTTPGGFDPPGAPTLVSIAILPNPASVTNGSSIQLTATGTYSDSSTADVTGICAWSNGGSPYFHMSGVTAGLVVSDAIGSGAATCTLAPASPANTAVNITAPPPASFRVSAGTNERLGVVIR